MSHFCLIFLLVAAFAFASCDDGDKKNANNVNNTNNVNNVNNTNNAVCGNGILEGEEACDETDLGSVDCSDLDPELTGALTCNDDCTFNQAACVRPAICGNGLVEGAETCDGTALAGQTCASNGYDFGLIVCNTTCDGVLTTGCRTSVSGSCGDGIVQAGEECDGATSFWNSCFNNGYLRGVSVCTDGCIVDYSGCDSDYCETHGLYADGTCDRCPVYDAADCELTCNTADGLCRPSGEEESGRITVNACEYYFGHRDPDCGSCGDGVVQPGEQCDGANTAYTCESRGFTPGMVACGANCMVDYSDCGRGVCGDGEITWATERCDGTNFGGLDCSDYGYSGGALACDDACGVILINCTLGTCGDGQLDAEGGESCDGSTWSRACGEYSQHFIGGEAICSAACEVDFSACLTATCGDGQIEGTEACEGSELNSGTCENLDRGFIGGVLACTAQCRHDVSGCELPVCGNNVTEGFELCDGTDSGDADCTFFGAYSGGILTCNGSCDGMDASGCTGTCDATDLGTWSGTPVTFEGDLCAGTDLYNLPQITSCTGYDTSGHEVVFTLTLPAGQTVTIGHVIPFVDATLYVLEDCLAFASCLIGADNAGGGSEPESLVLSNTGATAKTYFIVADAYSDTDCAGGPIPFSLTINP